MVGLANSLNFRSLALTVWELRCLKLFSQKMLTAHLITSVFQSKIFWVKFSEWNFLGKIFWVKFFEWNFLSQICWVKFSESKFHMENFTQKISLGKFHWEVGRFKLHFNTLKNHFFTKVSDGQTDGRTDRQLDF